LITVSRSARSSYFAVRSVRARGLTRTLFGQSDTSGFLTQKPEELRPMFEEALRRGIQVETHAIGDPR